MPEARPSPEGSAPKRPILAIGLAVGGLIGVLAGVVAVKTVRHSAGEVGTEPTAAAAGPISLERPTFGFQHPSDWKVDVHDTDYDPDRSFTVDSPGRSFMMFQIADGSLDLKPLLETYTSLQLSKVIKQATQTPFTRWGVFLGEGVLLKGKQLGATPGTVRIFVFHAGDQTFTVLESTYDDDRAKAQPGFDLIARTFHANAR